jgi:hypothetical protein
MRRDIQKRRHSEQSLLARGLPNVRRQRSSQQPSGDFAMSLTIQRSAYGAFLLTALGALTTFGWPANDAAGLPKIAGHTRIHPRHDVWVDYAAGRVILEGTVCIPEEGAIEVLACPNGTKEYESLVAVSATPQIVEAAILLATPAGAGDATGVAFDVQLVWQDGKETRRVRAQEWVLDPATQKPTEGTWRYVRGGGRTEGELLTTSNLEGVLNLSPSPKGNTAPPKVRPPQGAQVRIELTAQR